MTKDEFLHDCARKLAPLMEFCNWHWSPNVTGKGEPHVFVPKAPDIYRCLKSLAKHGTNAHSGGLFVEPNPDGSMEVGFTAGVTFEYEPPLPGQREYELIEKQLVIDRQNRLLDRLASKGVDVKTEAMAMEAES